MNFDRSLVFSYIEEDNVQRAYFRVRPLLTMDGNIQQEAVQLWPNEGGLRIVPDRNEQHTFKNRMRQLGAYCVVDLRRQPAEAGKIRTNKNFRPDRGEVNQYILYSDTVHELPRHSFYHLLDGSAENFAELAKSAITPLFFIRKDDTLYGPVDREQPALPSLAAETVGMLYEIPCPDQVQRMILCIADEILPSHAEEAVKTEQPQESVPNVEKTIAGPAASEEIEEPVEEQLPIGEALNILDTTKDHDTTIRQLDQPVSAGANLLKQVQVQQDSPQKTQKDKPLAGTPLVKTPLHVAAQPVKNVTQEIVTSQWSVGKYVPPAQNLPAGTAMHEVKNPVEAACSQLREAWRTTAAHNQLADFLLSLDGMIPLLEGKLCNGDTCTIMQRVLRQRLLDLEAERLSALCELDKAKRDLDAFKQALMAGLKERLEREHCDLEAKCKTAQSLVDDLKKQVNALMLQRDALTAKVEDLQKNAIPAVIAKLAADAHMLIPMIDGIPLPINPVAGALVPVDELISRMITACHAAGITIDKNTAIALLVLMAFSPRIGITCNTPASLATLMRNIAHAFGWHSSYAHQSSLDQHPVIGFRPVDGTPAILATSHDSFSHISGATKLLIRKCAEGLIRSSAYESSQWPIIMLPDLPFVPECDNEVCPVPVSAASLAQLEMFAHVTKHELDAVMEPIFRAAKPLSGSAIKEMYRFISICAGLMEGGLPSAVDWGLSLWVVPSLERGTKTHAAVKAILDEYPLSQGKC